MLLVSIILIIVVIDFERNSYYYNKYKYHLFFGFLDKTVKMLLF